MKMKSNKSNLKFVLFAAICFLSFNAMAQPDKINNKSTYYYFPLYELFVEKDNKDGYYTISPAHAGKQGFAFAKALVNIKSKTISLQLFNSSKVLVTSEIYSYADKLVSKKATFYENGAEVTKTWTEITTTRLE